MVIELQISEKRKRQCAKLVEISKAVVRQAFDRFKLGELGMTWTGGKDSGLGLWIIRQVCLEKGSPLPLPPSPRQGKDELLCDLCAFAASRWSEVRSPSFPLLFISS